MKTAQNLEELYKNFTPSKYLTQEEKEFYIDLYGNKIKKLERQLLLSENRQETFYVSGQSGSGKTTALHFLSNKRMDKKFLSIPLFGNELFELDDIEVIDI